MSQGGFRERLHSLLGAGLAALVYVISLLLVFWPFLLSPGALYARVVRDFWPIYNSLPEFDLGHRLIFHFGHFPLWNFLNAFGMPLLGDLQSAPFHPARLLFLLPFWKVIDIWLLTRVFLSGMLTYFFMRGRGAGWHGATVGGLAWMLTGSITDYINMHYLDIDLLLPAAALAFSTMALRRSIAPVIWTALVVSLAFLGGNPTSVLYLLIFSALYYFYNVYLLREDVLGGWFRFFAAAALSGLAVTCLLLPFIEFLANSWDYHPAGVGTLPISPRHLLTLFGPEVYGAESENGIPLLQRIPYFGVAPISLAMISLLCLRRMGSSAAFFAAVIAIFGGMVIGTMPFSFINYLPLLIRTSNFRYAVPEIAFCVAALAGFGWDHLTRWRETLWRILFLPVLISLIAAWLITMKRMGTPVLPVKGEGLLLLVVIAWVVALMFLFHRRRLLNISLASFFLLAVWTTEAGFHIHHTPLLAPDSPNTYASLPDGVDYRTILEGRVYASPGILNPNLNILHGAMDIRYLGALYVERYARFMRILDGGAPEELLLKFISCNYFDIPIENIESPLIDLMGITTVLTHIGIPKNRMVERIFSAGHIVAPSDSYVSVREMIIRGDRRITLFAHPPSRIVADMPIGFVFFGIGIDSSRWNKTGDGVTFSIYRQEGDRIISVFARHLDPANVPDERLWLDFAIPNAGGKLIFETTPTLNNSNDWAGWSDIRTSDENLSRFELIRDVPFKVYDNGRSLLGAFAVGNIVVVDGEDQAVSYLKNGFDFNKTAVVEGADAHALRPGLGPQDDFEIGLDRFLGDRVRLIARLTSPGVVVLTDSYYPGWRAFVDGVETKIFPADLAFRAVKAPAGRHTIEFIYRPMSFRMGLWSAIPTVLMLLLVVYSIFKNRQKLETLAGDEAV